MSRHAQRESFSRCPETCPAVDRVANEWLASINEDVPAWLEDSVRQMVDDTKEVGTSKLRDALTEACAELLEAQGECEDLRREIRDNEATIEDLRSQVRSLEREISSLEALA